MGSQNSSIVNGFVDEVKTYVPQLYSGIAQLRQEPGCSEAIQELHRLVHIIHGAASLVGMMSLSQTASQMEEALEEVMAGVLSVDGPLLDAMETTVGWFEAFVGGQVRHRAREVVILTDTVVLFRRLRSLPESGDDEALTACLDALGDDEAKAAPPDAGGADSLADAGTATCAVPEEEEMALLLEAAPFDFEPSDGAPPLPEGADVADIDPFSMGLAAPESPGDEIPPCEASGAMHTAQGALGEDDAPSPVPPEILAVFNEEVEEHFELINRNLDALEGGVDRPMPMGEGEKERLRQVRRAVHTIKGASGLVGMTGLPAWAHQVEDLLDWLFDEAEAITPDVVATLLKATDIMALYLAEPSRVRKEETERLAREFHRISGAPPASAPEPDSHGPMPGVPEETAGLFDALPVAGEAPERANSVAGPGVPRSSGTFRVGMEKLDGLVNLVSEQIIALSAFDQKLDAFLGTVAELDLSRARLRETSRNLEVGYEVKATQKTGTAMAEAGVEPGDAFGDFDSLELDRYSEFNLLLRDLAESAVDVGAIHSVLQNLHSDFEGYVTRQRVLLSELQAKMMHIRMAPMGVITTRMRRAVREVADKLGRKVRFSIRGEGIELDRVIWEKLADPLLHILRNAVDHGIEDPAVRRQAGKPETGVIAVAASREGNQVVIRIRDDGAGLDRAAIRRKAEEMKGVDAAAMGDEELVSLIFTPGFSTREKVTEISGRGVGMDVVKTNIEALKGTVRVVSAGAGKGTTLLVRIPLTLAVTRALLLTAGGQTFAVPLNEISDILRVAPDQISEVPMASVRVGEEVFPLYHLSRVLGLAGGAPSRGGEGDWPLVLKVASSGGTAAIAVDALLGQREIVIKSLGSHLQYVKGVSGATVMGDGSLVPILNVGELIEDDAAGSCPAVAEAGPDTDSPLEILIVDDSVSVRQVIARLLSEQGFKTASAKDGVEALEKLPALAPDLIVLDVEMPRMNGYEFLAARRSHPEYRQIPVIMLTSRSAAKYRDKARELGADGYVVKPFDDGAFLSLIHGLTMR